MDIAKLPYEALVFDLGNVIVRHDNDALYRRLASRCTAPDAAARIRSAAEEPRYNIGEPVSTIYETLRRELGYGADWDGFLRDWSSHFEIDWDMLRFVQRLGEAKRVMIFSNTNQAHWEHLVRATDGALGRIEAYLSYELRQMKPFPEAFRAVAARARIEPRHSFFTDDLEIHVEGARRAGFNAEVYTGLPDLARHLAAASLP